MKKFILLFAFATASLTGSAQLYRLTCGKIIAAPGRDYYTSDKDYYDALNELNEIYCHESGRPIPVYSDSDGNIRY